MRYSRQTIMECIGDKGQKRLSNAKVAVIGAGGLGCFVLNELALAGVGYIRIIEDDNVSLTNLNRQFIYKESDISNSKVKVAVNYLRERNGLVELDGVEERLTEANATELLKNIDIVVDCVDNVETRMIVNDYCVDNDIPLVEAAVNGLHGFVMAIRKNYPCLRCIGYENTKLKGINEAIGAAVGIVASIEALEVIKIIVGMDELLFGNMLMIDCNDYSIEKVPLRLSDECRRH